MQLQCISMTAPIEEKEALPPTKECKNLNDKDENDDSSAYNASQDLKERAQDWVEARSPNSGTQAEQLNAETTPYENIHSYDQGPSEEKDDMEAAAYEELRQSAFKALQCIEEDFAKLRERLYHERLAELDKEVQAIASGKHPQYATAHSEIERRRRKLLNEASKWRQHKEIDIGRQVESALRLAQVHFLAKRAELRRSIINNITEKRRKLRDEMTCSGDLVVVPDVHTIRHIREHSARENKEVVDISLDVGFPIGAKLGSLEQAEVESDVRMVITPFEIQLGYQL
ncbi:hypothetical protein VKS41_001117 [Umbelopsis sp. WA50703]